ncbi:MAG: hypothetical protein V1817_00210, partial [Candidatus Micrarchaeota archaeon]
LVDAARLEAAGLSPAELESKLNEGRRLWGYTKANDIERITNMVLSDLVRMLEDGYLPRYLKRKK